MAALQMLGDICFVPSLPHRFYLLHTSCPQISRPLGFPTLKNSLLLSERNVLLLFYETMFIQPVHAHL